MNNNYISYLKADKKSERTISEYTKYVTKMLNFIGKKENEITYTDLIEWKASISHLASSSVCLQIAAIKSYFKFLFDAEMIEKNPAEKLTRPEKKNKVKPYPDGSMIRAMVENARTDRDSAIILLFSTTGLRVSELINITLEQYLNMGENCEIVIEGKGSKQRTVYINEETKKSIDLYLLHRPDTDCDKLFVSFQGGMIHSNNLSQTLKSIARNAGIPFWKDISNHWLRAAAATMYAEAGVPIEDIRDLLGHSSISTTSVYVKSCKNRVKNMIMNHQTF